MNLDRRISGLKSSVVHKSIHQALQNFYVKYYDSLRYRNNGTGDASGIKYLSQIMEGQHGLLNCILLRQSYNPLAEYDKSFNRTMDDLQREIYRDLKYSRSLKNESYSFRINRNEITHPEWFAFPDRVQRVTEAFLTVVEEFYCKYAPETVDSIYDDSYFTEPLPKGFKVFGRFEIVQELGSDSHHRAYRAIDRVEPSEPTVALKIFWSDEKTRESLFTQEQKSAAALNDIYYVNRYLGSYPLGSESMAIVRQYIEGETLEAWFDETRRTPGFPYRVMCVAKNVLQAMAGIHKRDYVSCGIVPRYIIVNRKMEGWLTDFSRTVREGEKLCVRNDEDLSVYLPQYYSKQAQPSMDTFMLGMILCRLFTGNPAGQIQQPFCADICPTVFRESVTQELEKFINRSIEATSTDRFQDGMEMLEAFHVAFNSLPIPIRGEDSPVRRIGLVSCSRRKIETQVPVAARILYSESPDFNRWVKWSEQVCAKTYVISGRYGLVDLDQKLPEYDVDMRHFPPGGQAAWARFIVELLRINGVDGSYEVFIFADGLYRSLIVGELQRYGIATREFGWEEPEPESDI